MASHTVTGKLAYCSKFTDVLYTLSFRLVGIWFIFSLIFLWSGQNSVLEEIFSFYKTAEICSPKHARSSAKNCKCVFFHVHVTLYVTVCQMVHPSVRPSVLQCKRLSHVCYSLCPPARDGCFVYGLVTVLPVKTDVRGGLSVLVEAVTYEPGKSFLPPCLPSPCMSQSARFASFDVVAIPVHNASGHEEALPL